MSWIIAELIGGVSSGMDMTNDNRPKHALPRTRYSSLKQLIPERVRGHKGARFPWIHNKGAVDLDFHSVNISPSKHHVAVP